MDEARLREMEEWFKDDRNDLQVRARFHGAELIAEVQRLTKIRDAAAALLHFVPESGATVNAGYGRSRQRLFEALADYKPVEPPLTETKAGG